MKINKTNLPKNKTNKQTSHQNLFAFALVMVQVIMFVLNVWGPTFTNAILASGKSMGIMVCQICVKRTECTQ